MATLRLFLVTLVISSSQQSNRIEDDVFDEAKAEILKEQTLQNVGGLLNNFMHSEGAKQLGNILTNAATGDSAGEILQGLGSILGQSNGLDPSMLGAMINMMGSGAAKSEEGFDSNLIFSLLGNMMGGNSEGGNLLSYIPMILQTANAFLGPEAQQRAESHHGHADSMPPMIERIHIFFDHFANSELGRQMINKIGAEKFVKVFSDENGKLSYRRFVDMLENHSFRKHWIRMVTSKIAQIISHFADPKIQRKYLTTFQHFINSILKSQGYPKTTLFDQNRPVETITALVNHFTKETLQIKVDSKQYVKPLIDYIQDVFRLAQKRGMLSVDSNQLSDKLADTINLEVIEPIARVNRAYRFARKAPKCDKYVMCLVTREHDLDKPSLPGLRPLLSKSGSLIFSWFLSSVTKTPYLDLYQAVTDDKNCQVYFLDACSDFHEEEMKVKQEYVHNEL